MKKRIAAIAFCSVLFMAPVHNVEACDIHDWGYRSYTVSEQVFDHYGEGLDTVYNTKGEKIIVRKLVPVYKTVYYRVNEMYCTKCGTIGDSGRNRIG